MWPRLSPTCSASISGGQLFEEYKGPGVRRFLASTKPVARRTPISSATARSSFAVFSITPMQLGADKIATGHYAQVREWSNDSPHRFPVDEGRGRDQDRAISSIGSIRRSWQRPCFRSVKLYKREVRKIAAAAGLHIPRQEGLDRNLFHRRRPSVNF